MIEAIYNGVSENTDPTVVRVSMPTTYASGAGVVAPYTILGKVTATGKYVPYASGASDGSQNPVRIAPPVTNQDSTTSIDATSADVVNMAWATGCFNPDLCSNYDATAAATLEARGIFFKEAL